MARVTEPSEEGYSRAIAALVLTPLIVFVSLFLMILPFGLTFSGLLGFYIALGLAFPFLLLTGLLLFAVALPLHLIFRRYGIYSPMAYCGAALLVATLLALLANVPIPLLGINDDASFKGVWRVLTMYLFVGFAASVAYFIRWPEKLPFRRNKAGTDI